MARHRDSIEIPGMPTFWKSVVPPTDVSLPLILKVRRGFHIAAGAFYLLPALAFGAIALLTLYVPPPADAEVSEKLVMFGLQLFSFVVAPCMAFAAWRTLRDGSLKNAVLTINETGLADTRIGLKVAWTDIVSARPINGRGNEWGVSLALRDPALLPRSRWLRSFGWLRRRPNEVHLQTRGMSQPSYLVRTSIFYLAKEAGATIMPPR